MMTKLCLFGNEIVYIFNILLITGIQGPLSIDKISPNLDFFFVSPINLLKRFKLIQLKIENEMRRRLKLTMIKIYFVVKL